VAGVNPWALRREEPEHLPAIRNLLIPNPRGIRAASSAGEVCSQVTPVRYVSSRTLCCFRSSNILG
jgi:hypothetical protein